jgi:hypothetical protein
VTGRVWQLVRSGDIFAAWAGVEKEVFDSHSQASRLATAFRRFQAVGY